MRSLLFVPGDSPSKLDKGMGSGADVLLLDLEDSIAPQRKAEARATTAAFLKAARQAKDRPRLFVRVNGFATGLTDDDLDAVVAAQPDGIMLPKAEGGAAVIHCDAKITAREAVHGLPDGALDLIAIATETAAALFLAGSYGGASKRLKGLTWGAEDLSVELGAEANRDAQGIFSRPISSPAAFASPAPRPRKCRRSTRSMSISATRRGCAANARRRAATASPARWRSIRRRLSRSTRCSRRAPKRCSGRRR